MMRLSLVIALNVLGLLILGAAHSGAQDAQRCAIAVTGPIAQRWLALDGFNGPLGCPTQQPVDVEHRKDLPGELTPYRPTIAAHQGKIFLAWRGEGNPSLNIMVSNDNGASFTGKATLPATSASAPSLISHDGSLFIAWRELNNNSVNVAKVTLIGNTNGEFAVAGLEPTTTLNEQTDDVPSLASFGGKLYVAFKGLGNRKLNIVGSGDDGKSFPATIRLGELSDHAPSLGTDGGRLLLTWAEAGNNKINIATVTLFGNTAGGFGIEGLTNKVTLGETSTDTPTIGAQLGKVFVGWTGGENALNLIFANAGANSFTGKKRIEDLSQNGPTLASVGTNLWITWRGLGNDHLNVGKALFIGNTAGGFGVDRIEGGTSLKQEFQNGEIIWSPSQGPKMAIAAYRDHDNLILNWGPTNPFNYDVFQLQSTHNGVSIPQIEITGFIERDQGFYWLPNPLLGHYTFSIEGCAVSNTGAHTCPEQWTLPVTVDYVLPPLPDYSGKCPNQPLVGGLIGEKWAELGGPEGPLGCSTAP